jgi:ATP phosphoribosyltransferase regulatory subunit
MAAETARQFEALEAQARQIMSVFLKAGHEAVAPATIQPAGVYLDVIGEELRARTYVFTDPDGHELCLRPDITVPTCRLHLERNSGGRLPAKYCYNGAAFRFQAHSADKAHPREFRQAGIEAFGGADRERAEAETMALVVAALKAAGLRSMKLRIGDLGLFRAILKAADMPPRWRQRLADQVWRHQDFRAELARLATDPASASRGIPGDLAGALDPGKPEEAERSLVAYLEREGIEMVGARSASEIAASLLARVADARSDPLAPATVTAIERYVAVRVPARDAAARVKEIVRDAGIDIGGALETFERRLELIHKAGVDIAEAEFSAEFGRALEYYTGFVFEIVAPGLGRLSPVAGGGRYDRLMKSVGAPDDVPAVGAAIHTERLLAAVTGEIL